MVKRLLLLLLAVAAGCGGKPDMPDKPVRSAKPATPAKKDKIDLFVPRKYMKDVEVQKILGTPDSIVEEDNEDGSYDTANGRHFGKRTTYGYGPFGAYKEGVGDVTKYRLNLVFRWWRQVSPHNPEEAGESDPSLDSWTREVPNPEPRPIKK